MAICQFFDLMLNICISYRIVPYKILQCYIPSMPSIRLVLSGTTAAFIVHTGTWQRRFYYLLNISFVLMLAQTWSH